MRGGRIFTGVADIPYEANLGKYKVGPVTIGYFMLVGLLPLIALAISNPVLTWILVVLAILAAVGGAAYIVWLNRVNKGLQIGEVVALLTYVRGRTRPVKNNYTSF